MAIGIENFTNVDTSDPTNYPNGQIKDDPGDGTGTPANVETNGDIFQFFYKLLDLAGITANDLPENVTNGYQLIQALANYKSTSLTGAGEWVNAGTPAVASVVGGGSVTIAAGDVEYNRYKIIGRTLFWQMKLSSVTVSGTVSSIIFTPPSGLSATSLDYVNSGHRFYGFINGQPGLITALSGATAPGEITIYPSGGGNFPTGTNDQSYDFMLTAELYENP